MAAYVTRWEGIYLWQWPMFWTATHAQITSVIEASGVANLQKIADATLAEQEMRYGGIMTAVDGLHFAELIQDPLIGPQVKDQIACADLLQISACGH